MIRVFLATVGFQLRLIPRDPTSWMALAVVPFQAVLFLSIIEHADRPELAGYAVVAPAVIAVWTTAIFNSATMISKDRESGTLEALISTPASMAMILLARILTVTVFSMLAVAECWVVAALLFDTAVPIHHPWVFIATLAATAFAMAGSATALSAVLVLSRAARAYANSLSYPIYLLGGVMVPVGLYPEWLQPLCRLVFLSWSTDLLRETLDPDPMTMVLPRLVLVVLLGALFFGIGMAVYKRVLDRIRGNGTVALV